MPNILFADANSDYKNARYVICGVPFDGTSSFRTGSRLAPQEMRAASYNFETYSSFFDIDLADVKIHDAGDLKVAATIDETLEMISVTATALLARDCRHLISKFPSNQVTFP